jgi:hypothetical protein
MTLERMPAWRLLFLVLSTLAMAALLLAAACGGDDDDDDDDGGATATEDSGDDTGDDSGDDGGATETDDSGDGGDDDGGDAISELEDLAGAGENASGVITYTISSEGTDSSTWTVYTEGDNSRIDFGDDSGAFISITTPEATYTCTEGGGDGVCYAGEGGIGSNPFEGLFTAYGSSDSVFQYLELFTDADVESSSEELAGVDANCYTASGDFTGDAGTIKWCFAENGLLLLSSYDLDSGAFEMRATEFSEDVPDDAFEPPYDVTEIPGA